MALSDEVVAACSLEWLEYAMKLRRPSRHTGMLEWSFVVVSSRRCAGAVPFL